MLGSIENSNNNEMRTYKNQGKAERVPFDSIKVVKNCNFSIFYFEIL